MESETVRISALRSKRVAKTLLREEGREEDTCLEIIQ